MVMKKRGVHGAGKRSRPVARKTRKGSVSDVIERDESSEIRTAERVIRKDERIIEKDVNLIFGPHEFHVVTLVASLIVLGFIFNSTGLLFYSVLTIAVLAFAHFLKKHYRPHDILTILGLFFLPLLLTIAVFRDVLVWLLLAVYALSALSTVIIYHYHKKAHPLLKVMWQVTYSKVVAVTLALLVACLLPLVFPDAFFSVIELIFLYVLPVIFVFFFASKFFYLYFFDRRHLRHDLALSLRHTLIYSLVFMLALMCIYSLFAASFYNGEKEKYDKQLDTSLVLVSELEDSARKLPAEIFVLPVTKDMISFAGTLHDAVSGLKSRSLDSSISLSDIIDDSYVSDIVGNNVDSLRLVRKQELLAVLKSDIIRKHDAISAVVASKGAFSDGTSSLDSHVGVLKDYVDANFVPYSKDQDIRDLLSKIDDPGISYDVFERGGFSYMFVANKVWAGGFDYIYNSGSIFGRQMSLVTRHMSIYRDIARLTLDLQIFTKLEELSPSSMEIIYENRGADSVPMSMAIRYELLAESSVKSQGKRML